MRVYQARRAGAHSIDSTAPLWEEGKFISYIEAVMRAYSYQSQLTLPFVEALC
jgi:hypothetical protein